MIDAQDILTTAQALGGDAAERQAEALPLLCEAAGAAVEERLLPETDPPAQALLAGAAYLALSWLPQADAQHFTAGNLSVSRGPASERAAHYAALSERLLAPYVKSAQFAFLGVES